MVESVRASAEAAGARAITRVTLRIGALSGVVEHALRFGYEIVTRDTPLAGAALEIVTLPAVVACASCGTTSTLDGIQNFTCPACGAPAPRLIQGKELEISGIEIEVDEQPLAA